MRKKRSSRIAAAIVLALGWLHVLGWSPSIHPALAAQQSTSFCQILDADDVLRRLGERTPANGVRFVVNKPSVEPRKLVQARLLNFTRALVRFGSEFKIQRHGRAGWKIDPSSPDGPWPRRLGKLSPGHASDCYQFEVPAEQGAGRYRFLTKVSTGSVEGQQAAKFSVVKHSLLRRLSQLNALAASPVQASGTDYWLADELWRTLQSYKSHRQVAQGDNECVGCTHDERTIRTWSLKHFPASYAGMYFEGRKVLRLTIGYTSRQAARVRAAKRLPGLIDPLRVSEFPYVPKYSLGELNDLQHRILNDVMRDRAHSGLLVSVGVGIHVNQVDVGTEDVKRARMLLRRLYGTEAPIRVRYEEAPVEI